VAWPIGFCHALNSAQSPRTDLKCQSVDAVTDSAGLHQEGTAFAAKPCAGEIADAFFLGGEDNSLDVRVCIRHTDRRRVACIRYEDHVFDVVGLEHAEHVLLPILSHGVFSFC